MGCLLDRIIGESKGTISPNSGALIEQHPGLIYEVELPRNNRNPLNEYAIWCNENVGMMSKFWDIKVGDGINLGMNTFIFLNEEDAMGFKLAWGE